MNGTALGDMSSLEVTYWHVTVLMKVDNALAAARGPDCALMDELAAEQRSEKHGSSIRRLMPAHSWGHRRRGKPANGPWRNTLNSNLPGLQSFIQSQAHAQALVDNVLCIDVLIPKKWQSEHWAAGSKSLVHRVLQNQVFWGFLWHF